jgi:hypothetical protein
MGRSSPQVSGQCLLLSERPLSARGEGEGGEVPEGGIEDRITGMATDRLNVLDFAVE